MKDIEIFYTCANGYTIDDECSLVDQVEIDVENKCYALYLNADYEITDGYDKYDTPINSWYVSRTIFDIIVKGVVDKGFTKKEIL